MSSEAKVSKKNVIGQINQQEKQVIYTWSIHDFCEIRKQYAPGEATWSPVFSTDVESQWQLQLYPQGDIDGDKEYISIYTFNRSRATIKAQITYFVMDGSQELCTKKMIYDEYKHNEAGGYQRFLKVSDISAKLLANNNKLIIKCKIELDNKHCTESHKKETQIHYRIHEYDDFEQFLNNKKFSDVILTTGDEQIHAHKNILAIKSAVFAAMFEHDMAEKDQNVVEIKDISSNVLKEMLRYIYAGKVNDITDIASYLLVAADKYLLNNLKDMCEETLCDNLSLSNALEYLNLAEIHNAPMLKTRAIRCIGSNLKTIINNPEFLSNAELDSSIMCEVFQKLVEEKVDKQTK